MASFFDHLRGQADKASFEANRLMRINRVQGLISGLRNDIRLQKVRLGEIAWELYQAGQLTMPGLLSTCEVIQRLEAEIRVRETEIQAIRAEPAPSRFGPATTATQPCPNCLHPVAVVDLFCGNCGARMAAPGAVEAPVEVPNSTLAPTELVTPHGNDDFTRADDIEPAAAAPPPSPEPEAVRAATTPTHCRECGAPLMANAVFCTDCGATVAPS